MNKAKSWENDAVLFARTCTDLASLIELLNNKAEQLPAYPFLRFWSGGLSIRGINMNILVLLFFVFFLPLVALLGRLFMPQLSSSFSNIT
jgi:hypothetical protein